MENLKPIPWLDKLPCSNIPKKIIFHELLNEIAIHEASHFVFCRLIEKLDLCFLPVKGINFFVTDDIRTYNNEIDGFHPCVFKNTTVFIREVENFFKENPQRIFADCLMSLAGYASYRVFIKKEDFFISIFNKDVSTKVFYTNIEYIPFTKDKSVDFYKISANLEYAGYTTEKEKRAIIIKCLLPNTEAILKKKHVKKAIEYVKQYLIINNNRRIEGKELAILTETVDSMLKTVSIKSIINKCVKETQT